MKKDITEPTGLHALRRAVREARLTETMVRKRPTFVEDIIIDRLINVEADLAVAVGLFRELAEDKRSPFIKYGTRLSEALDVVQDALYLRNPGLYELEKPCLK